MFTLRSKAKFGAVCLGGPLIALAIGAINAWNRLAVGMRAEHPVDKARDAA